ncbi:MAG TPA: NAD(P)/FAD-dependent oxidoreductase [Kofleriaceae bacterium]|nr:NAD(P)/FAD-dependent oxidoreductase [Kofleriaceae bacterium]
MIGAGLSGLVCATRLVAGGATVRVLEARERVGGRLHTGTVGGASVDLGGQWMTAGQPKLAALAGELGVAIEHHDRAGKALVDDRGGLLAAFGQWRVMRRIEKLMKQLDRELDNQSLGQWFAREIRHSVARERIALHADLIFATDPSSLSLLHYLTTMNATSGFRPESTDEYRFSGGAQGLALRLAEGLSDRVQLGEPVTAIEQDEDGVTVRARESYRAKRVVLAIPPPLVKKLAVDLPPGARAYVNAAFSGRVVKCFAAYAKPAWRDRGYSGESYHPRGAVRATVEIAGEPPVLLAFVVGTEAARWSTREPEDRKREALAAFAPFSADPPLDYLEVDWGSDPWSAGCVPALPPRALSAGARWRECHGRLHIAGTESAAQWPGYMEGAIDAGERAATEVLAAL